MKLIEAVRWLAVAAALVLVVWLLASMPASYPPPDNLVHDPEIIERAQTIILVRLVSLEMLDSHRNSIPEYATMLVLKSWKGSFSAGRVLHTDKGLLAWAHNGKVGDNGEPDAKIHYPFQLGDQGKEFLIMSPSYERSSSSPDLIFVPRSWTWPAEKSQALMAALDQAIAKPVTAAQQGAPHARERGEASQGWVTVVASQLYTGPGPASYPDEASCLARASMIDGGGCEQVPNLPAVGDPQRIPWLKRYCGGYINAYCARAWRETTGAETVVVPEDPQ